MKLKYFLYSLLILFVLLLISTVDLKANTTNTNAPISIQNAHAFPNPFDNEKEATIIIFNTYTKGLIENATIIVVIYDYNGKKVWTKKKKEDLDKGIEEFKILWGGQNDMGVDVANGLYFAKIIVEASNTKVKVIKILVK